ANAVALTGPTMSLTELADAINNNLTLGNTTLGGTDGVTATAATDANGRPIITIATADTTLRVVLANKTGDVLGTLGMNTMFTGRSSADIAVKTTLMTNPGLLPTARVRASDGGISSLNADNITALAQLADSTITFGAAGGLPATTVKAGGYA